MLVSPVDVIKTVLYTTEKRAAASWVRVSDTACATEVCVNYPHQRSLNNYIVV